jgi:hypothetical protein
LEACWSEKRDKVTMTQHNQPANEDGTTKPAIQQELPPLAVPCEAHAGEAFKKPLHTRKTNFKPQRRKEMQ